MYIKSNFFLIDFSLKILKKFKNISNIILTNKETIKKKWKFKFNLIFFFYSKFFFSNLIQKQKKQKKIIFNTFKLSKNDWRSPLLAIVNNYTFILTRNIFFFFKLNKNLFSFFFKLNKIIFNLKKNSDLIKENLKFNKINKFNSILFNKINKFNLSNNFISNYKINLNYINFNNNNNNNNNNFKMLFFNNFYLSSYEQFVFLIFNPLIFKIFNLKLKKKN